MTWVDAAVIVAILAVLAYPALRGLAVKLLAGNSVERWRQRWTATLITLLDQLEAGQGQLNDTATAVRLAKELLWEVIGGDGTGKRGKP